MSDIMTQEPAKAVGTPQIKPGEVVNLWRIGNGLVAVAHPAKVKKVDDEEITVDCLKTIIEDVPPFKRSGKPLVGRDDFPCYTRNASSDS